MELYLPEGFAQCSLSFTGAALPTGAAITFGVALPGATLTPQQVGASISAAWTTNIKSTITPDVTLASVHVKFGPMEDGPFADVAAGVVGTGTGANDAPPVALLVRKNTNIGGKRGHGRMYVPGLASTVASINGSVTGTDLTNRQTAWSAFRTDLENGDTPMVVCHNFGTYINAKGEEVTVPPREPSLVTSLSVQNVVATQRRRQRR
jgi:hypothetical protein